MVIKLLDTHLSFMEYFLKSHITRYIDKTYREMQDRTTFYGGSDRLLFTTRVGDMGIKDVVTTEEDTPIRTPRKSCRAPCQLGGDHDRNRLPVGMVTDRDLRDKVVSRGRDVQEPVRNIMSTTLIRVDSRDYCFEAVLKMIGTISTISS